MKPILIFILGLLIFGITFAAWYLLNALACGMNTTGCSNFHLNWGDWDSLQFFVPTFVLGLGMMVFGAWRWSVSRKQ